jgi:hypothetical protein
MVQSSLHIIWICHFLSCIKDLMMLDDTSNSSNCASFLSGYSKFNWAQDLDCYRSKIGVHAIGIRSGITWKLYHVIYDGS